MGELRPNSNFRIDHNYGSRAKYPIVGDGLQMNMDEPLKTLGPQAARLVTVLHERGSTLFANADVEDITGLSPKSARNFVAALGRRYRGGIARSRHGEDTAWRTSKSPLALNMPSIAMARSIGSPSQSGNAVSSSMTRPS